MHPVTGPDVLPAPQAQDDLIPVYAHALGSWQVTLQRRPLSPQELAARYDRAAARWGRTIDRLDYPRVYEGILRAALERHAPLNGRTPIRALDCGVGTGALATALARAAGGPLRLDGLDLSARMLDRARERLREAGIPAALHRGDAQAMPFADDTFDVVMAAHLLEHLPDPARALAEMVRVVRPGGLVVACLTRRTVLGFYVHLRWRTHMLSQEDAVAWLRNAGLAGVDRLVSGHRGVFRRLSIACIGTKPA